MCLCLTCGKHSVSHVYHADMQCLFTYVSHMTCRSSGRTETREKPERRGSMRLLPFSLNLRVGSIQD